MSYQTRFQQIEWKWVLAKNNLSANLIIKLAHSIPYEPDELEIEQWIRETSWN